MNVHELVDLLDAAAEFLRKLPGDLPAPSMYPEQYPGESGRVTLTFQGKHNPFLWIHGNAGGWYFEEWDGEDLLSEYEFPTLHGIPSSVIDAIRRICNA